MRAVTRSSKHAPAQAESERNAPHVLALIQRNLTYLPDCPSVRESDASLSLSPSLSL